MYPILMRFADRDLLQTAWEYEIPAGRPPRHLYRLTQARADLARELNAKREVAAARFDARGARVK